MESFRYTDLITSYCALRRSILLNSNGVVRARDPRGAFKKFIMNVKTKILIFYSAFLISFDYIIIPKPAFQLHSRLLN